MWGGGGGGGGGHHMWAQARMRTSASQPERDDPYTTLMVSLDQPRPRVLARVAPHYGHASVHATAMPPLQRRFWNMLLLEGRLQAHQHRHRHRRSCRPVPLQGMMMVDRFIW